MLNVKQWATRAHINLASEVRVLTYLVHAGVTAQLREFSIALINNSLIDIFLYSRHFSA